jgi:hypothetical protein
VRFAFLAKITDDGRVIDRWSTRDHLDEIKTAFDQSSFLDRRLVSLHFNRVLHLVTRRQAPTYDYFHPNSVQEIGANAHQQLEAFRPGNLLVCFRNINQIAALDARTMEILWTWGEGELQWPHHATMLENGNVLVFDNGIERKFTRALEIDPTTGRTIWQYPGDPADPDHRFYSPYKGSAQRLGNGNTLICDAENGRVVEVTPAGRVVWEFFYPELNRRGQRASIYRAIRYPEEMVDRLIETRGANLQHAPPWSEGRPAL